LTRSEGKTGEGKRSRKLFPEKERKEKNLKENPKVKKNFWEKEKPMNIINEEYKKAPKQRIHTKEKRMKGEWLLKEAKKPHVTLGKQSINEKEKGIKNDVSPK